MHYIRFLRAPKVSIQKPWATVSTIITITTDLGDDFLATELPIYAFLVQDGDGSLEKSVVIKMNDTWKPGSRVLRLTLPKLPTSALNTSVQLLISTTSEYTRTAQLQHATIDLVPSVLHAWSTPFDLTHNDTADGVERRLTISESLTLRIREEMGESIARHVWDAGVVLAALMRDILVLSSPEDNHSLLARRLRKPAGLNAIELGSGCGIVGLQLALICERANVMLTDLPEAMEVLEQNIRTATLATGSRVSKAILDWDGELPEAVAHEVFDLVLISDCTYNCDSIPALIQMLGLLIDKSPKALVVVAMKVRHESEAVFHELIGKAGLRQCSQHTFKVPDRQRQANGQELETVDIYVYQTVITTSI